MKNALSIADRGRPGRQPNPVEAELVLALAHAEAGDDVAFGPGLELALARGADGQAETAPEWVQIVPAGQEITAIDGRRWTLPDPDAVVAASTAGAEKPFDINHASEIKAPKGEDAPAQGWIKAFARRAPGMDADDGLWARVEWTAAGAATVLSKAYRYVSPAFRHSKDGVISRISSVALVTHPALDQLPALLRAQQTKDQPMLKDRLIAALALAATATDDQIVEAATSQASLARETRDPAKFRPTADYELAMARATTAEGKLTEIDTAAKDTAAVAAVDAATLEGKIAPAGKEHWLSIARENPDGFAKAMAAQPKLTTPTATDKKPGGEGQGAAALTADQLALCGQLGVEPAAYAATLAATPAQ